jgi:hypothetical protein
LFLKDAASLNTQSLSTPEDGNLTIESTALKFKKATV